MSSATRRFARPGIFHALAMTGACALGPRAPTRAVDPAAPVARIVVAARGCEDLARHEDQERALLGEADALFTALAARGIVRGGLFEDPDENDVSAAAAPDAVHPLLVFYLGHGQTIDRGTGRPLTRDEALLAPPWDQRSVLCLRRRVPADQLAMGFRAPTPFALLVLNACQSAFVDPRLASTSLSILSASTLPVAAHAENDSRTPLGAALIESLGQAMDFDGDGFVSDWEWFRVVESRFTRGFEEPDPKLRRQVYGDNKLFPSKAAAARVEKPGLRSAGVPYDFARRRFVRFDGRVDDQLLHDAGAVSPSQIAPVPCPTPLGQCFVLPNEATPRP